MKKLFLTLAFFSIIYCLKAQHYGGVTFTPFAVENFNGWRSPSHKDPNIKDPSTTFGFAVGYQGLLMADRRFSFSYGLLYTSAYNRAEYQRSYYDEIETGRRVDMNSIQIPLWWRYNIVKNKKWQPFIAISTSMNYALVSEKTYYYEDSPPNTNVMNKNFFLSFELGVGVNYTSDKWMFTIQPTFAGTYTRQLGVGFSVLRKF